MRALDLGHVHEAGGIADQRAAREDQLGNGLQPALVQRPSTVGDATPALEMLADIRVGFEALHLLERRQPRILVVQTDHESVRHQVLAKMVQERTAVRVHLQRPAGGMLDEARFMVFGRDFPQLLDADGIGLILHAVAQIVAGQQLLGQRAPAALGEQRIGGAQLHPAREIVGRHAVLADAHVAGGDADHAAVFLQYLRRREAGVDFNAQLFGLRAEPAADVAQRHDVVAVVVHLRRSRQTGRADLGQEQKPVDGGRRAQRRTLFPPIGDQFVQRTRLQHRARQRVGADFPAFFHQTHGRIGRELFQAYRRGQPCWAAPHDHHIELHCLPRGQLLRHVRLLLLSGAPKQRVTAGERACRRKP